MPKDRSSRSVSHERCRSRVSPYKLRSGSRQSEESAAAVKQAAEWEEVRCPVCMDHPHNAVMLVCSSHEKGCRPFMCDTSYRHSNCLDQYRKASKESSKDSAGTAECIECQQPVKLACPLCRGPVSHWTKDYDARKFMNSKDRACTMESCEFKGSYNQLRKHAREDHPAIRPMEVDPDRQRDWHRMEQQRDLGDLFSMLRSGFSGREDGTGIVEAEEGAIERSLHGPSITMVFIVRSGRSFLHYTDGEVPGLRSRTILVLGEPIRGESSRTRGANSNGDAEATTTDNEEADDLGLSTEASAGSQQDVGEVDGDTAQ